jgi:hypothetical protein
MTGQARLGIDIGRVIIDGASHPARVDGRSASSRAGGETAFFNGDEATMLATPEMAGSVEAIATLVSQVDGRVWLVSKASPKIEAKTLRWLDAHDFYRRTGLPRDQVRYCRARADKRNHCVDLELTHFVDDHPEVHEAIRGTVQHQYFFGPQSVPVPSYGVHTPSWAVALERIGETLVV